MRISQDGKIKLASNEKRLGNFIIKNEEHHVKVFDISQVFTYRVRKTTAVGKFLEMYYVNLADGNDFATGLKNYITVLYAVHSTVPDLEFLNRIYEVSEACMKRHPEVYGIPAGEPTEEDDANALDEVKGMTEFEEEVRKASEKDESAEG